MLKFTTPLIRAPFIRTLAVAALVGSFGLVNPVHAAPMDDASSDTATQDSAAPSAPSSMHKHEHGMAEVETRIKTLHDKLKITSDQEDDWKNVADTMRDNEANLDEMIKARHTNPDSMTAIDDLQSYQKIMQAHADGLSNMIESFQALYNEMPADQQKNADEVFGKFEGHRDGKMHHGMKKPS